MPYQFEDLKKSCQNEWQAYIEHGFVQQLGNATLAPEAFQHYLKQDYLFLIQFALSPCMVGYGEIANWLNSRAETIRGENNPYDAWIAMYESDEFQEAMRAEISWLNERLADVSPARFKELTRIFSDATRLEIDFWEMGLKQSD